jgi:sulfur-carrier protein
MKIRFFGRLRDAAGAAERLVAPPAEVRDTEALRAWLGRDCPALLDASVRLAVNDEMIVANRPIRGEDEIAFLPPMSGG